MAKRKTQGERFQWRENTPFKTIDADVAGKALEAIAKKHQVGDIRRLDARILLREVKGDPRSPLRAIYDFDNVERAAERYWLDLSRKIIASIQVVEVSVKGTASFRPEFVPIEIPVVEANGRWKTQKMRAVTADALKSDPAFASAIAIRIRAVDDALRGLEWLASSRKEVPEGVGELCRRMREAMTDYRTQLAAAAE